MRTGDSGPATRKIASEFGIGRDEAHHIARVVRRALRTEYDRGGNLVHRMDKPLEDSIQDAESDADHFNHILPDFTESRRRPGRYEAECMECGFEAWAEDGAYGGSACSYECDPL